MKFWQYFENHLEFYSEAVYDVKVKSLSDLKDYALTSDQKKVYSSIFSAIKKMGGELPEDSRSITIGKDESTIKRPKISRMIQNNQKFLKILKNEVSPDHINDKNPAKVIFTKNNIKIIFGSGEGSSGAGLTLKPQDFIPGNTEYKYNNYVTTLSRAVESKVKDKNIKNLIKLMINAIDKAKVSNSRQISITIPNFKTAYDAIDDQKIINKIGKNFGECLSAMIAMKLESTTAADKTVEFPSGGNFPLIDFFANGKSFSAKFKGGASPSITSIYKYMTANKIELFEIPQEKQLFQDIILPFIDKRGMKMAYAAVAEKVGIKINNMLPTAYVQKNPSNNDNLFYSEVIVPMVKKLNESKYKKTLNTVCNKILVDQVYLFFIKNTGVEFKFYHFKDHTFNFHNGTNSKTINLHALGFSMD